ncbi:hypothetical protein [Virgibacillus siamensis]|uniref:hypothetical protein n=1 Tax=Virgibacillus siamensis TaxID=480071 RepID=UPI00158E1DAF|nr:hypothetical protein [Virgibacillus siamensis]
MDNIDWQMLAFVGTSLVHDYWNYWGLPKVYFWNIYHENESELLNYQKNKSNAS